MNKQSGMVLITIILLLALLTLLVLSQMQMVFLSYKGLNQFYAKHQSFYQLEAAAFKLASVINQACIIKETDPDDLISLLTSKQGCIWVEGHEQFFYLIENLGLFPCLQTKIGETMYSTQHWRITILNAKDNPAFLQLRFARRTKLLACDKEPVPIKTGLLSWRHVPVMSL
ncbi:hypothetical protein [Legionella fairfieldensis]|uniref:hypothetical protein n=1 Tax=Legionella fairfieldensis TaxID=45064 RepID=UPI00048B853C|nr:hypothetical protein [Legionella fairfieldensis]